MDHDPSARKTPRRADTGAVTMAAVGRLAGVSQVTVSRALSDPSKVSPDTLARIREAIRVTGFVPNALAGALASRRSMLITALVPSFTNIVYASLLKGFSDRMRAGGYQIMLSETGFDPREEEALIFTHLSRRPDGVLLTGIHHTDAARRMLLGSGVPVVEIWDITDTPIDICVGFSHVEAGRRIAEFARETGQLRALTITANDERAHRRRAAFAERFSALGGTVAARVDCTGPASLEAGRRALAEAIEQQGFSGGFVQCSSDVLAQGALIEARVRGFSVPQEIAVMGFGDQDLAAQVEPSLTTVRVDRAALGHTAAEELSRSIAGEAPASRVHDLGFEVIRRASA